MSIVVNLIKEEKKEVEGNDKSLSCKFISTITIRFLILRGRIYFANEGGEMKC